MRIWCWFLLILFFLWSAATTSAQEVVVRGLLPNPSEDEQNEWILVENNKEASLEAQTCMIRDTQGSIKEASLPAIASGEVLKIGKAETGISLNNSQDSVEILCAGEIVASSAEYEQIKDDQVWWLSNQGNWLTQPLAEFLIRIQNKDWNEVANLNTSSVPSVKTSQASDAAKLNASSYQESLVVTQSKQAESTQLAPTGAAGAELRTTGTEPTVVQLESKKVTLDYQNLLTMPRVIPSNQDKEASTAITLRPAAASAKLKYPQFDREQELDQFKSWKSKALTGSLSLVFAGGCLLMISVPSLWSWYNEKRLLW